MIELPLEQRIEHIEAKIKLESTTLHEVDENEIQKQILNYLLDPENDFDF